MLTSAFQPMGCGFVEDRYLVTVAGQPRTRTGVPSRQIARYHDRPKSACGEVQFEPEQVGGEGRTCHCPGTWIYQRSTVAGSEER
jgi:hypothetical protein